MIQTLPLKNKIFYSNDKYFKYLKRWKDKINIHKVDVNKQEIKILYTMKRKDKENGKLNIK